MQMRQLQRASIVVTLEVVQVSSAQRLVVGLAIQAHNRERGGRMPIPLHPDTEVLKPAGARRLETKTR
jgi:hypothetical protein